MLIRGSEGIWTKGSFVRNTKHHESGSGLHPKQSKKPNHLFVNAALKSGRVRADKPQPGRSKIEEREFPR